MLFELEHKIDSRGQIKNYCFWKNEIEMELSVLLGPGAGVLEHAQPRARALLAQAWGQGLTLVRFSAQLKHIFVR